MINVLLSIVLFAAVKVSFLWVFGPKGQRVPRVSGLLPESENVVSLMGKCDRQAINPSLRFRFRVLNRLGVGRKGYSRERPQSGSDKDTWGACPCTS